MSVKFKIGFTISGETLFGIIAKFLPVENLQVEEIEPHIAEKLRPIEKIRLEAPKKRNRHTGIDIAAGGNAVVMAVLADGQPHSYRELRRAIGEAGFASSGIGAKLARLKEAKVVLQPALGMWQIAPERKRA
jgi:hypothetical protein